ncbi:NAD(P)-dependent oxidoreductase [Actinosynnema sp. ALI-1.44]|uniref:NAD(P)-dependent oxidoreductase n=1 Tax=Actinosynnema sp. ALI-1.44 TaxID=1933779 RepID=UPI00097C3A01|nr:NAD(P)H-binding protein [Actinosynnema sp. ALI-1.44]
MKVLVIGAAGRTGTHVVEQGLARKHEITAFSRRPTAAKSFAGARALTGDATDVAALRQAVRGQEAVISAVGCSAIAAALVEVMSEEGVRRLVMTSSRSVVATRPRLMVGLAWMRFRCEYADLARAEGMLETSALDWSIVRGTMLVDKPAAGRVHIDFEANASGGDWRLTRADYAMALLDVAEDPRYVRRSLGVGGPRKNT